MEQPIKLLLTMYVGIAPNKTLFDQDYIHVDFIYISQQKLISVRLIVLFTQTWCCVLDIF